MSKITMYPTSITQPNKNKSSGLAGTCFKEVRRNGKKYNVGCRDQKDPKYHHQWVNTTNLKTKGKAAQCGVASKYHCNHSTYYSIKGYRNTCPIAGVTGTYTMPATLRMKFDLSKKGIKSAVKVNKVTIKFQHRCVGVNVANSKETVSWGPNFDGFSHYPNRKALKLQFVDSKGKALSKNVYKNASGTEFKNPPLSTKYGTVTAVFTDVSYNDIKNGFLDVKYGNNLSTNPGNIYIKNFTITVDYTSDEQYIEGKMSKDNVITDNDYNSVCVTENVFTLEAGYKQGSIKKNATSSNTLQSKIQIIEHPKGFPKKPIAPKKPVKPTKPKNPTAKQTAEYNKKLTQYNKDIKTYNTKKTAYNAALAIYNSEIAHYITKTTSNDNKTVTFKIKDFSGIEGKKKIKFGINNTKKTVSFTYTAKKTTIPTIEAPSIFEHNTKPQKAGIIAKNGCASNIKVYFDSTEGTPLHNFTNINNQNTQNILPTAEVISLYETIAKKPCGPHTLFIVINNKHVIEKTININPVLHEFKAKIDNNEIYTHYSTVQDKTSNLTVTLEYITDKVFSISPKFKIKNTTFTSSTGQNEDIIWEIDKNITQNITLGKYHSGKFDITVSEIVDGIKCAQKPYNISIDISPEHKQYYDELFVKINNGTSVNYDYLVAWEGDSIRTPINIKSKSLNDFTDNISFCAPKSVKTRIGEIGLLPLIIKNQSEEDIENLYVELNVLRNDGEGFNVTTDEWIEQDGLLYDFKSKFEIYNPELQQLIDVINLSKDNDFVDEENVYLKINKIESGKVIKCNLPFQSRLEKEIKMQILLFENPINIHPNTNCTSNTTFKEITLQTKDAVLVDLSINGEFNYFNTEIGKQGCPEECFTTSDITYTIKNIDTASMKTPPVIKIENDPRLIPIEYTYRNKVSSNENDFKPGNTLTYQLYTDGTKTINLVQEFVHAEINFPNGETFSYNNLTDNNGRVQFFVTIPKTCKDNYTLQDLLNISTFTFEENDRYSGCKFNENNSGISQAINTDKDLCKLSPADDYITYKPGNTAVISLYLTVDVKYIYSEMLFKPKNKLKPNTSESIKVKYKVCNLDENQGILTTTMSSDEDENLMPNTVSKQLFFGIPTDVDLKTKLTYRIIENQHVNTLKISLINRKRPNENVEIKITEMPAESLYGLDLYNLLYYQIDDGYLIRQDENTIIWKIDYIEPDKVLKGIFDFKAQKVGISQITVTCKDFLSEQNIDFGEDSYKCQCRKKPS